jgi:hypothetical protein
MRSLVARKFPGWEFAARPILFAGYGEGGRHEKTDTVSRTITTGVVRPVDAIPPRPRRPPGSTPPSSTDQATPSPSYRTCGTPDERHTARLRSAQLPNSHVALLWHIFSTLLSSMHAGHR